MQKQMATHSITPAWRIPWTEVSYSLWGCEESDMTEILTLSLHRPSTKNFSKNILGSCSHFFLLSRCPKKLPPQKRKGKYNEVSVISSILPQVFCQQFTPISQVFDRILAFYPQFLYEYSFVYLLQIDPHNQRVLTDIGIRKELCNEKNMQLKVRDLDSNHDSNLVAE